ncbi:MAG: helix-turn-helix domain-containing protein [Nitrospira sp.]|nr:helix-turn-helix domain-containing protein [Nitrospira sp.]
MYLQMLTVKELSAWLNIKESTLYLWASQNKIPCRRIHGLVRFEPEAIQTWLDSFSHASPQKPPQSSRESSEDVDHLIAAAKHAAYTSRHGETITPSPRTKEEQHGAR